MKSRANQNILKIQPYTPGKPIEEVKRELGLKKVIKLASNENPFPPSPAVLAAIRKESKNLNRYPDSICFELRNLLSKQLKVDPDQLIFGNGSDEILVLAVRAFVQDGDEVVIAQPSFLIYEIASKIAGAHVYSIPLKDFRYDLEGMLRAVTPRTKVIFIGNPDNPAGTYITTGQVKDFMKRVPHNVLTVFDEAYFEYVKRSDYPDTIALLKSYGNVLITRTFSKMYGLAGLRIGYGIANPELIDYLNRLREPFNVNSVAQAAAIACLKDRKYFIGIARTVEAQRRYIYKELKRLNLRFVDTVTNFILIDLGREGTPVAQALLKKGVIIRDMKSWGLQNFIRITIGTEQENRKLLKALKAVISQI